MTIQELQDLCHKQSFSMGWWRNVDINDPNIVAAKLCLIHSEISEALEGVRKDSFDSHLPQRLSVEVELADAIIRILDLAGALELDMNGAIIEKLQYNRGRIDHQLAHRDAAGGKKI